MSTSENGHGTISFRAAAPASSFDPGLWSDKSRQVDENVIAFRNVPDAVYVAQLTSSLQAHQNDPTSADRRE
ncbi:MAG TPA: hypothetical protein VGG41_19280 [Solirubrobacteraceae bacterium]